MWLLHIDFTNYVSPRVCNANNTFSLLGSGNSILCKPCFGQIPIWQTSDLYQGRSQHGKGAKSPSRRGCAQPLHPVVSKSKCWPKRSSPAEHPSNDPASPRIHALPNSGIHFVAQFDLSEFDLLSKRNLFDGVALRHAIHDSVGCALWNVAILPADVSGLSQCWCAVGAELRIVSAVWDSGGCSPCQCFAFDGRDQFACDLERPRDGGSKRLVC